ncbi:50S ribosomal protein L4 [Candidatus Micrarchaeota archaeon RBG_16_36_9]|nr:ribosomal protein L4p Rpl4p [uncultured archaeon]OGI11927.1 MAG: 50S ribosomal protein L4 [Candidatus Micrarchaeota archaeon RBG_16_36_9]
MKAIIFDVQGNQKGEIELPKVFNTGFRPDVIKRAVIAIQTHKRQPYGSDKLAGKRTSAHYHGVREGPGHMMNIEKARMARIHGGPPNLQLTPRFVPQARKGREAHPPKVEKVWYEKINNKERVLAIKSAIAATASKDIVSKRGHFVNDMKLPIVVDDSLQQVKKAKNVEEFLEKIGLKRELERSKVKKVRAGKGKRRGRKYNKRKSILFVISENKGFSRTAKNMSGIDICLANNLNAELLAPGTHPGRLTIFTESAIKKLGEIYG